MFRIGIECESIEGQTWGVGRIVNKLLEEIDKRPELRNEFRFFLYFKSRIPDLPYLNNPIFIKKIIGLNSFSLYYYFVLPIKLWFEKLDLVFFPNYMLPILFRGKSLVILTEDIYYEINSGQLPCRYKLAYRIFAGWWAAGHATKIMAISETSKKEITKLFKINPDRIVVNTLGIDPPKNLTRNCLPAGEAGKLKTENYILYVGQAFPRRHLRETMLAFEKLISKPIPYTLNPKPLQLIAIGYDKYNPPIIENLVKKINDRVGRNAIIYKDYVPEEKLAALFASAKLVIYVSSKEAFGLPPIEALAYGVPPIVSDQPITREIFGDEAFFVQNPDNLQSIADTIKEGLENQEKRENIIKSAPDILKKYTWHDFTDRFLNELWPTK